MTTSNLSGAIDNAFIDRADIKQYIGLCVACTFRFSAYFFLSYHMERLILRYREDHRPPAAAVYWILSSCLNELMRAGLIPPVVRPFHPLFSSFTTPRSHSRFAAPTTLLFHRGLPLFRRAGPALPRRWRSGGQGGIEVVEV